MPVHKQIEVDLAPGDGGEPYIALRGPDGRRLSSRDKVMRCTDTIIGSRNYALRWPALNEINVAKLGDCHESATFVWGYVKITSQGAGEWQPPPSDAWISAGGSYVQIFLPRTGTQGATWCEGIAVYSFYADGGEVFVEERLGINRVYYNDFGQFGPYPGFTLNYHLWCCAFD